MDIQKLFARKARSHLTDYYSTRFGEALAACADTRSEVVEVYTEDFMARCNEIASYPFTVAVDVGADHLVEDSATMSTAALVVHGPLASIDRLENMYSLLFDVRVDKTAGLTLVSSRL